MDKGQSMCVIGCAGFIGSNLSYELVKRGYDVTGIDNLSTGFYENVMKKRFYGLSGNFHFVKKDMNDRDLAKKLDGKDTVFLLAALPRVSFSTDHPLESNYNNINGTLNVLEASKMAGVERVVFSCSSSIFGGVAEFPTPESARMHPKSNYALQKVAGAEYCRLYGELYGLDTVNLLYYNVFGPLQRADSAYSTVVPAFLWAAMNKEKCRIDGTGNQSRDLCYIDNVVQANILAAESKKKFSGDMFNIANGETHSINEIYAVLDGFFGGTMQKVRAPKRLGDPFKSHADISKARKVLGYKPTVGFLDGLEKTFEWWVDGCKV